MDQYKYTNNRPAPHEEVYVRQNHFKIRFINPDKYHRSRNAKKEILQWLEEAHGSVLLVDGRDHERLPESK